MVRKYALIKKCALIMKPRPLYVKYRLLFPREVTGMAASDGGDSGDAVYFHPRSFAVIISTRTFGVPEPARFSKLPVSVVIDMTATPCLY